MFLYLVVLLVLLIPLLAIVLDSQLGRALAQRLERGRVTGGEDVMAERVAFLEGEVDRLNDEITRIQEESDFLHKLLTERSGTSPGEEGLGSSELPPGSPEGERKP
ncbi:MAG: hypothetical protein PVI57_07795 [Gemmatimonadota bacterium]|jgi:hypothetical protein